jgi:class 3 adenylate cyclase
MVKFEGNHKVPEDIQEILDNREQLDQLLKEKFTKPVAVMFADLKGSTEFFETHGDIAGLAMINKYNSLLMPVIEERGRVVEVIGDAIMACFDSPEAAVKTAVEMQETLQAHNRQAVNNQDEIHIRIGINYGPGIVTEREDGTLKVSGDVVNTAARVEAGGGKQTDQILISRAVYEPIQQWQEITCKSHGSLDAKGKARLLEIYRVVWDPAQEEREATRPDCPYPGMVPFSVGDAQFFYGREAEIHQMVQHLRQQRFLLVIGPSGSGKSSLVFAGLLPQLQTSTYFSKHFWLVRQMRPGPKPTETLVQLFGETSDVAAFKDETVDKLLAKHAPAQRLLVVVDQFEEVFT